MVFFSWPFRSRRKTAAPPPQAWAATPPQTERTYLADTPYLLPKDAQEDRRLNFQHSVLYRTISNHYLAPISPDTKTILDVGTGTGIWPMEISAIFPQAHIIGVDVAFSSLPPTLPETCIFVQANILQGLPFPDQQFDYTHQRLLVAAIPAARWPTTVRELVRVTRSGGWIELLEIGDTIQNAGPATKRLLTWMTGISKQFGFEMGVLHHLGDLLTEAGCQTVEAQDIPVPLGDWAGGPGQMMKIDVLHGYTALKGKYCEYSNTPAEVFDKMIDAAVAEWEKNRASYVFHAAYGRKG